MFCCSPGLCRAGGKVSKQTQELVRGPYQRVETWLTKKKKKKKKKTQREPNPQVSHALG